MRRWEGCLQQLCLLLSCLTAAPATAKVGFQGALTLAEGYNDNPLAQPVGVPDYFFELRPQLILTIAHPRVAQRLAYTFSSLIYLRHPSTDNPDKGTP